MKYYLSLLFILLTALSAVGQGTDAAPAGVMLSHGHPKGGWMVSYTYMNMEMKDILSGTEKLTDEDVFLRDYSMSPRRMNMDMHMLMGMWGATGNLSFMLMAEYRSTRMEMSSYAQNHIHNGIMKTDDSNEHTHHTSGLGDVKLWALYKLLNKEGASLVFSLGVNIPSGDYRIAAGEHALIAGQRETYMMQLGSGSFDVMPGMTWLHKKNKVTWSAQLLSVIRPANNQEGYHWGNEVILNAWGAYHLRKWLSASLRAEANASEAVIGRDDNIYVLAEPAANPANYGGQQAITYAGINFYINKGIMRDSKAGVEFGLPVMQHLNGIQQGSHGILFAGITKSF